MILTIRKVFLLFGRLGLPLFFVGCLSKDPLTLKATEQQGHILNTLFKLESKGQIQEITLKLTDSTRTEKGTQKKAGEQTLSENYFRKLKTELDALVVNKKYQGYSIVFNDREGAIEMKILLRTTKESF